MARKNVRKQRFGAFWNEEYDGEIFKEILNFLIDGMSWNPGEKRQGRQKTAKGESKGPRDILKSFKD